MKRIFLLFVSCFLWAVANSQSNGFVRVTNNRLVDIAGKPLYLNGINLGGWLLWEGWIMGAGFIKESKIKDRLEQLMGHEEYLDFLKKYYNTFITEKDIALVAANGFNSIRLPFNYRLFSKAYNDGIDGCTIIDNVVSWCKKYHVYLVLDMHAAPGGQSPWFIADPSDEKLWQSEDNKKQTLQLWSNIASRYRNEPIIAGYDLLNEPDINKQSTLIAFYNDLIKAIRLVDTNHVLIVEGNKLAKEFKEFPEQLAPNQMYSYHYYSWFAEKNKEKNLGAIVQSINTKTPVWCGEWGEDSPDNLRELRALFNKQENLCGTAFWTWKRVYKNNNRMPFYTINATPAWNKIMSWVTWQIAKPDKAQVKKGAEEFLTAISIENCLLNEEVKAAIKY